MDKIYKFIVSDKSIGQRIDIYLDKQLNIITKGSSRSFVQKYFDRVLINSKVKKKNYKIKPNDIIEFSFPEPEPINIIPENIDFETVYEDNDIIVVNKPPGLVVHPAKGNNTGTLLHGIIGKLRGFDQNISSRPGIVHRLDKDTSGLMVIAKNIYSQRALVELFKNRMVEKKYHALVRGLTQQNGKINSPIKRHNIYRKKFTVSNSGKPSLTYYNAVKYYSKHTLLEVKIVTGRTHQIRVHLTSIGYPIVGDIIYSKPKNDFEKTCMALCAKELCFNHPITNKKMSFQIDLPLFFKKMLNELTNIE